MLDGQRPVERFTAEIALDVEVEIVEATRARPGRHGDRPERSYPADPAEITLAVWLYRDQGEPLEVTAYLPADVLEGLQADALERLQDEADEALLP